MTYLDDYKQARDLVKQGCPDFDYCYLFNKETLIDITTSYDKIVTKCSKETGYSKGHVRNILNGYNHTDLRSCVAIVRGLGYDVNRDNIMKFFRLDCIALETNINGRYAKTRVMLDNIEFELRNIKNELKKTKREKTKFMNKVNKFEEENKKLQKLVDYYEKR